MKRAISVVLSVILIICIIPSNALAEDYSTKSDDELIEAYNAIRIELTTRGYHAENNKVLYEDKNVQIYVNGEFSVEDHWGDLRLKLPVVIVNNSSKNICVQLRNESVNGWGCESVFSSDIPAGKKVKDVLQFELGDTDVESIEDFEDVEFSFHIFDNDSWGDSVDTDSIHLYAN